MVNRHSASGWAGGQASCKKIQYGNGSRRVGIGGLAGCEQVRGTWIWIHGYG